VLLGLLLLLLLLLLWHDSTIRHGRALLGLQALLLLTKKDAHNQDVELLLGQSLHCGRQRAHDCLTHRGVQLGHPGLRNFWYPRSWERSTEQTLHE
jgi:hypothetical protein